MGQLSDRLSARSARGSETVQQVDKFKRAVVQTGGTNAPIKSKLMTVKLKPGQILGFKTSETKTVTKKESSSTVNS